jgi:hypothetical protein
MSARAEQVLNERLELAIVAKRRRAGAAESERRCVVAFIDEALHQHKTWDEIGAMLEMTGTGARRYYNRNRRNIRGG